MYLSPRLIFQVTKLTGKTGKFPLKQVKNSHRDMECIFSKLPPRPVIMWKGSLQKSLKTCYRLVYISGLDRFIRTNDLSSFVTTTHDLYLYNFQQARARDLPSYNSPSVQQILDPSAASNLGASSRVRQKCCQNQ